MSDNMRFNFFKQLNVLTSGERATLKRSCGTRLNDADARAFTIFYKVVPDGVSSKMEDRWFFAACISCLWESSGGPDLASKFKFNPDEGVLIEEWLAVAKDSSGSFEKRVTLLLGNEWDEDGRMNIKLTRVIKMLKQKNAGRKLNMVSLLYDIINWDSDNRYVQKRWAKTFYQLNK